MNQPLTKILLIANIAYIREHGLYTPGRGVVNSSKMLTWKPFHIKGLNLKDLSSLTMNELSDISDLNYKMIITIVYLLQGYTVFWNYRVNRSTILDLYVQNANIGYTFPNLNKESYKLIKHWRTVRISHKLHKATEIYMLSPIKPIQVKFNRYWKDWKWIQKAIQGHLQSKKKSQ